MNLNPILNFFMKYFILLVLLNPCTYSYGQSHLSKDHYVILPFDKDAHTTLAKNSIPASLNDSDFDIIDQVLSICIDKYNREQTEEYNKMNRKFPQNGFQLKDFIIDLRKYYRQYIVTKNKKGEKEVWVNCFCTIQNMDYWKKQVVFVMDGGNCFFNVKINLSRKSYSDFEVNGEA
jgi:hypothetical protein